MAGGSSERTGASWQEIAASTAPSSASLEQPLHLDCTHMMAKATGTALHSQTVIESNNAHQMVQIREYSNHWPLHQCDMQRLHQCDMQRAFGKPSKLVKEKKQGFAISGRKREYGQAT
jgi:hypothetical protein